MPKEPMPPPLEKLVTASSPTVPSVAPTVITFQELAGAPTVSSPCPELPDETTIVTPWELAR